VRRRIRWQSRFRGLASADCCAFCFGTSISCGKTAPRQGPAEAPTALCACESVIVGYVLSKVPPRPRSLGLPFMKNAASFVAQTEKSSEGRHSALVGFRQSLIIHFIISTPEMIEGTFVLSFAKLCRNKQILRTPDWITVLSGFFYATRQKFIFQNDLSNRANFHGL